MKIICYVTIFFAAFFGSMIILIPFGLLVQESIILTVTMLVAAIPAALAAGWVGNAFGLNGQRSQLKAVVQSVGKTAVFLAIFQFLNVTFSLILLSSLFMVALVASFVLALSSVIATVRYRQHDKTVSQDIRLTLLLMAVIPVVPCGVLFATWLGLTNA